MWKSLLVLGCTAILAACAANPDADPFETLGKAKRQLTADCLPQVGSHIIRRSRCVASPVRVYSSNSGALSWTADPSVRFGTDPMAPTISN